VVMPPSLLQTDCHCRLAYRCGSVKATRGRVANAELPSGKRGAPSIVLARPIG
jgi:hypothetical protein